MSDQHASGYMHETDGTDRLHDRIIEIVNENWKATQSATLLSALGGILRREFGNHPALADGLAALLRSRPIVQLVTHPQIPPKIGAVPLDARLPEDLTELFPAGQAIRSSRPIYFKSFWRAFHTPISGRRFVRLSATDKVPQIIDTLEQPVDNGFEILPSDIVSLPVTAPLAEKTRAVFERIKNWLIRNGLQDESFIERSALVPESTVAASPYKPPTLGPSEFTKRLARLSPSDHARIFIPLDLVLRMLDEK